MEAARSDVFPVVVEPDVAPPKPAVWGVPVDVTIEHVVKDFGETPALHDVSLKIEAGELVALLGPSGSGKTTLLRVLAGLEFPTAGRVLFGGEDALGLSVQERHIGFVFQSYALFKSMKVFDNIAFGLTARPARTRPSRAKIRDRVLELLDLVQLTGLENRYPTQLSGGQRQRVALARALAIEPRILLLDEPFGALDAKVRRDLRRWLREIHDQTGHTTVFVTHDQEEAIELADRIVVLNRGKIEQIGSARRDLRPSGIALRRRFHRRIERAARPHRGRPALPRRPPDRDRRHRQRRTADARLPAARRRAARRPGPAASPAASSPSAAMARAAASTSRSACAATASRSTSPPTIRGARRATESASCRPAGGCSTPEASARPAERSTVG